MQERGDCERAFVASHVSEGSMVLKVLERLRPLRGLLLVECGLSFSLHEVLRR